MAAVGGLVGSPGTYASPARAAVALWRARFDDGADDFRAQHERLSRSGDSQDIYFLAYGLDAFTAMFSATGDRRYADTALSLAENVVGTATVSADLDGSQFQDDFRGWASHRDDTAGEEVSLFEAYGWRYVTRMLRVVSGDPLSRDPAVRRRCDRVLAFTEDHVFDKWYTRGVEENLYRDRTHMAANWAFIATDLRLLTRDAQRRDRCDEVAGAITDGGMPNHDGASLRGQLERSDGAYVWSRRWDADEVQDVAHGNNVVAYVIEARDTGRTFTDADMAQFGGTATRILDVDDGRAGTVDGEGRGSGWLSDGFVKLGRFDAGLQRRLEARDAEGDLQYVAALADNAAVLAAT